MNFIERFYDKIRGDKTVHIMQSNVSYFIIFGIIFNLIVIYFGITSIINIFWTKNVEGTVIEYSYITETDIYVYGIVRRYSRSSVPSCAWDVDRNQVYVCTQRDTNSNCISGHYEDEFDYSVRAWEFFKTVDTLVINTDKIIYNNFNVYNVQRFKINNTSVKYNITVLYRNSVKTFKVNNENWHHYNTVGQRIPIKIWKKSKNIKKLLI